MAGLVPAIHAVPSDQPPPIQGNDGPQTLHGPTNASPPPPRHGRARPDHPRRPERPTLPNHSLRHQNGTDWTAPNVSRPPQPIVMVGLDPTIHAVPNNQPSPTTACATKTGQTGPPQTFLDHPQLVMAGLVPAIHAVPSDQPPPIKAKHQRSKKNEVKPTAPDVSRPPPSNPASSHPTAQKPPKHPLAQSPPTTPPNHSHFLNPSPVS